MDDVNALVLEPLKLGVSVPLFAEQVQIVRQRFPIFFQSLFTEPELFLASECKLTMDEDCLLLSNQTDLEQEAPAQSF